MQAVWIAAGKAFSYSVQAVIIAAGKDILKVFSFSVQAVIIAAGKDILKVLFV